MFSTSLDTQSKWITGLSTISFLLPTIALLKSSAPWYVIALIVSFFVILNTLLYLFSPKGYQVTQHNVVVHRIASDFSFNLNEVMQIYKIDRATLGRTWRMWGNYGLWGYTGWYSTQKFGTTRWFVTHRDKLVFIRLSTGKKYILSPENPEDFIDTITSQCGL